MQTHPRTGGTPTGLVIVILVLATTAWTVRPAAAQPAPGGVTLRGEVIDEATGLPVTEASVLLRSRGPEASSDGAGSAVRRVVTGPDGAWVFRRLSRGRYDLEVERFGYRSFSLELELDRDEALFVSVLAEPVPFPLRPVGARVPSGRGPDLLPPAPPGTTATTRPSSVAARRRLRPAPDTRHLSREDLRAANTLAEDDLFRALQQLPGVAFRDEYVVDLWTRGGSAGQTALLFDGVPVLGGLHALGAVGGVNTDMLATVAFHPGLAPAAIQGGGAGVVAVTSRSGVDAPGRGSASLSPLSLRVALHGRPTEAVGWAVGVRRSWVDALVRAARSAGAGVDSIPYAFVDLTGRGDLALGDRSRLEVSGFWQGDRVSGDIPGVPRGNEGEWGARVARASLGTDLGDVVLRHTVGVSAFDASVETTPSGSAPLHPSAESRYRTLLWETRLDGDGTGGGAAPWSVGLRVGRETNDYDGPGLDVARLVTPEELARRGFADFLPVIVGIARDRMNRSEGMTRWAVWGGRRLAFSERLTLDGGLRVEGGDRAGASALRLAPRLQLRVQPAGSPLSLALGWSRAYQYVQSVARTDVVRTGLRVSDVLAQADGDTPPLRSDVVTLGGDLWQGEAWLLGGTLWYRHTAGVLLPDPVPGAVDSTRSIVAGTGDAAGLELSARKLAGAVRGFANYTLSRSRHHAEGRSFAASEDRRHVANLGVTADLTSRWLVGGTFRIQSGAPFTRITLIDTDCGRFDPDPGCGSPPVMYGTPGGQRAHPFASLDLMAEWSRPMDGWTLEVYGQLRNVLGRANRTAYHSSCLCVADGDPDRAELRDRFDRGLPRLPLVGLRARF